MATLLVRAASRVELIEPPAKPVDGDPATRPVASAAIEMGCGLSIAFLCAESLFNLDGTAIVSIRNRPPLIGFGADSAE